MDQIQSLFQTALKLQAEGKFEVALERYFQILKINPRIPEVHFRAGEIFNIADRYTSAIKHLEFALNLAPTHIPIWNELARSAILQFDPNYKATLLAKIQSSKLEFPDKTKLTKKLQNKSDQISMPTGPRNPDGLENVKALITKEHFSEALNEALKADERFNGSAVVQEIIASIYVRLENYERAKEYYHKTTRMEPDAAVGHMGLGLCSQHLGDWRTALHHYKSALVCAPFSIEIVHHILSTMVNLGKFDDAVSFCAAAKKEIKDGYQLEKSLGTELLLNGENDRALLLFLSANKSIDGKDASLLLSIANTYETLNDYELGHEFLDAAEAVNPNDASIFARRSNFHYRNGETDRGDIEIKKAISMDQTEGDFYLQYIRNSKSVDPNIVKNALIHIKDESLDANKRIGFGFALSIYNEKNKEFDAAFEHMKLANDLTSELYPFKQTQLEGRKRDFKKQFGDFNWDSISKGTFEDARPIFILGLPRSGTTLIEQIISSHSEVSGAGEVQKTYSMALMALYDARLSKLRAASALSSAQMTNFAKAIWNHLQSIQPGAKYITDKSLKLPWIAGLLGAAMPNAKFVIIRRDPRDNLLSMYKNQFVAGAHNYSNNLEDLAHHYNDYIETISFWKNRMSDNWVEIHYENLVENSEAEAKRLIAGCGLEWEDKCLNFHKEKRVIKTLSIQQARQPIYASSKQMWKNYEAHLQPMFDILKQAGNYPSDS